MKNKFAILGVELLAVPVSGISIMELTDGAIKIVVGLLTVTYMFLRIKKIMNEP